MTATAHAETTISVYGGLGSIENDSGQEPGSRFIDFWGRDGYAGQSETRKGYTGYEKDTESGLDFAQARYYNATHGRFTSADPLTASATIRNPQTFNRYIPVRKITARTLVSQTPNPWRKSGARAGRS